MINERVARPIMDDEGVQISIDEPTAKRKTRKCAGCQEVVIIEMGRRLREFLLKDVAACDLQRSSGLRQGRLRRIDIRCCSLEVQSWLSSSSRTLGSRLMAHGCLGRRQVGC
jgi:hypothetical protein